MRGQTDRLTPLQNDRPAGPARYWRSYGDDQLPSASEALNEPFSAFPSWFLRVECDRCGKPTMITARSK